MTRGEGRRSAAGASDEQFLELVERESRGLVAAAAMIVGNRATAEEIVQDVLERTYERWTTVGRLDRPGAWVRRAVVNQSISVSRRSASERRALDRLRRRRSVPIDPPDLPAGELWAAVRALPEQQATAVALHYGADLSLQMVAEEMDLSSSAVKTLLYRARVTLRSQREIEEIRR